MKTTPYGRLEYDAALAFGSIDKQADYPSEDILKVKITAIVARKLVHF